MLLLDEPTNPLDLESVKWLESFLRSYSGTVIVVSHDRAFMDNMVDRVAEVDNQQVNLYKGKLHRLPAPTRPSASSGLKQERTKRIEEMKRLRAFVEKFRQGDEGSPGAGACGEAREAEGRARAEIPEEKKTVHFNFKQPPRTGDMVVEARGLRKSFGDHHVYDGLDFHDVPRREGGARRPERRW